MPIKKVLQGAKVPVKIWTDDIEEEAEKQLLQLASLPFVFRHVAVMPDVHAGKGSTIGTVYVSKDTIIPAAVGVDIGCGMAAVQTPFTADALEGKLHKLRGSIEEAVPVGFVSHKHTSRGVESWEGWADFEKLHLGVQHLFKKAQLQMGTLGGGNHFIEICLDNNRNVWILLHSGSRHIGKSIADVHINVAEQMMKHHQIKLPHRDLSYLPYDTKECKAYIHDVQWAQAYARENREKMLALIMECVARQLNDGEMFEPVTRVNCHHNYIAWERHFGHDVMVTRKGAIRAQRGDDGIIPGSMGTRSYIVKGLGNEESFHSASHGAGRRMSRTKAKSIFTSKDLEEQTKGVECRKDAGVIDEIPKAYKDIDTVIRNENDLVEVVTELKQVICVKG